jgi:uncharacterized membrane protein YccC
MTLPIVLRRLPAWGVNGITVTLGLTLVQCSISFVGGAQAAQTAIASAVCASLADVVATTDRVARRVLVASIASIASGTIFLAIRPHGDLLVPAIALIVFAAMLLMAWGPKAGSVSFGAALSLVFAMSLPDSQPLTWERVGWGLAGSAGYWIWAVATARLLQPTWRNFAVASTAESEARLLAAIARQINAPKGTIEQSGILEEEAALAERLQNARDLVFGNDEGPNARRETAILLHLIDLRDLAMASNLESSLFPTQSATQRQPQLTARIVEGISDALRAIAEHLRTGVAPVIDIRAEQAIRNVLAELEQGTSADRCGALLEVNGLLHSKLEHLRSIQRLLTPESDVRLSCQRTDLRRYITPDEWQLASVVSNLRPGTPVFRHAVRTCVTAGVAYAVSRLSPWTLHPQWIILTITAVMQGSLAQTLIRRNARILGTLAGCLVVALLTTYPSTSFLSASFLVASGVGHAFFGVRYSVTAGAAAVMAVLQSHLAAPASGFGTLERLADTVAGGLLGWAATYVLPIWERKALPSVLQQAEAAMRAYAAEATALRADATGTPRFARQRAYDAIRAVSAIRSRSLAEPESVRVPLSQLTSWLSAAYGLMSNLSNLRLTLTLHGRDTDTTNFAATMTAVSHAIDTLLDTHSMEPKTPPALGHELELVLATVPHLASRVHRTLEDASRVSLQLAQIQECFATRG